MSDNGSLWVFMDRTCLARVQYTIRECLILKENLTFEVIVSYLWGTVKSLVLPFLVEILLLARGRYQEVFQPAIAVQFSVQFMKGREMG